MTTTAEAPPMGLDDSGQMAQTAEWARKATEAVKPEPVNKIPTIRYSTYSLLPENHRQNIDKLAKKGKYIIIQ